MRAAKPAVFLDRDGVVVKEVHHLTNIKDLALIPRAGEAIARLNNAGVPTVIVTNQSAVGRGLLTQDELNAIHDEVANLLRREGARIDAFYFCPHHPTEATGVFLKNCNCRKPRPGMLLAAAEDLSLDLARSFLIGDKITDLRAGQAAGCSTILVRTGYGHEVETILEDQGWSVSVVDRLQDAVGLVLRELASPAL